MEGSARSETAETTEGRDPWAKTVTPEGREAVARVEALLEQAESLADPAARATATELLRAVLELYGQALARVIAAGGDPLAERLAEDELVSHLLLLHDLHPWDLRTRVTRAMDAVRPRLGAAGVESPEVELEGSVARVRLRGARGGCGSTAATARRMLEEAILDVAPEIDRVEIEEIAPPPVLIPVESLWPMT